MEMLIQFRCYLLIVFAVWFVLQFVLAIFLFCKLAMACRFYFFVFLLDPYFQSVSTSSNQYLGLKLTSCPSDFFTAEILPVFFLFWFLWIRRHDWISGYMMGRGTSRQIIPQLCSYNTNTLITYHAYVTYMCKQEHIYHTMWHAMSRQWLLHTFWCVRPTIL